MFHSDYFQVHKYQDKLEANLSRKPAEEREPEVAEREREVLVEEVVEELAHAQIGPSTVDEEQTLEVRELSYRVVAREDRLHAFLPVDANANVSSCNVK